MINRFIEYTGKQKRYSQHTLTAYKNDLKGFESFLMSYYELDDITLTDFNMIRSWIVMLIDKGMSARSVNRKISCLSSFFNYLKRNNRIKDNPVVNISPLKVPTELPVYLKEGELINLLNTETGSDYSSKRARFIIELLYNTGIRRSELINIRIDDFDKNQKTIKVTGKRNKQRIIPLSQEMTNVIVRFIEETENHFDKKDDFVILTNKGKQAYPRLIYSIVNKELVSLSGSKKSPHVLRHTFATHMLNNGADLNIIKEILGHSNLSATQVYTHNSIGKLKSVYNKAHPRAKLNKGG